MGVNFTKEQQAVIDSDNCNLLVSASAGSGKTTVMIERIIKLLLKYKNSDNPLSISNFLVVTFTKASASDMKHKLIKSLSELPQDEFIISQIEKVSTSDISNLHSFCSRLISTYFYEIGIDPVVRIVDDAEATFLKNKALDKLFELKEDSEEFFELFDIFQKKRSDIALREIIKRFDANLKENLDGEKWFFDCIEKSYISDLNKNESAQIINKMVASIAKGLREDVENLLKESEKNNATKLSEYLVDLSSQVATVNFNNSYIVNAKNVFDIKIKSAPKLSLELLELETKAKNLSSQIKKNFENFKSNFISNDEEFLINKILKSKELAIKLYNFTKEFNQIYEKIKKEMNCLDFNDLEHYALKILDNDEICKSVKKKYRYILVDEYQDINSVQEKILCLVSSDDNRFMVGDVKQSIYRFRFCDPDIFLDKFSKYSKGEKHSELIKLNCNFRSDKKILKFVDCVFDGVMTDNFGEYDYRKNAIFVAGEKNLDNEKAANLCFINLKKENKIDNRIDGVYSVKNHKNFECLEDLKSKAEACLVYRKINEIMAERPDVSYGDFAILVSSRNENIDQFVETLKSFNLPVSSDKKYDLMKMIYIQEIVNFVKLCVNKNNDIILFKVLKSRLFNFLDEELAQIRLISQTNCFYECFFECTENNSIKIDETLAKKISAFKTVLNKFVSLSKLMLIKEFVNEIIEEFDLILINQMNINGNQIVNDINNFVLKLPNVDVFDYVNSYADYSLIKENECSDEAVKIMTIHKSKGIEFKFVFLINLANEFNFKSTYQNVLFNKNLGVGLDCFDVDTRIQSSTIPISAIRMIEKRKLAEEQQRLLYVAMTRAVEKLFVVCLEEEKNLSEAFSKRPTAFIDWFAPIIKRQLSGNGYDFLNFEKYDSSELNDIPQNQKNKLNLQIVENIEIPNWFIYEYNDRKKIPLKNSISKILADNLSDQDYENQYFENEQKSSADRGILYHKIMQLLDLKDLKNIDSQLENILKDLSKQDRMLIDEEKIKNVLKWDFFNEINEQDVVFKEREFYARVSTNLIDEKIVGDEFILQGIVDLIIIKENELWILDYKTGKFSENKMKKYKIQLDVYADVMQRALKKKVTRKLICFIDEQKNIEF